MSQDDDFEFLDVARKDTDDDLQEHRMSSENGANGSNDANGYEMVGSEDVTSLPSGDNFPSIEVIPGPESPSRILPGAPMQLPIAEMVESTHSTGTGNDSDQEERNENGGNKDKEDEDDGKGSTEVLYPDDPENDVDETAKNRSEPDASEEEPEVTDIPLPKPDSDQNEPEPDQDEPEPDQDEPKPDQDELNPEPTEPDQEQEEVPVETLIPDQPQRPNDEDEDEDEDVEGDQGNEQDTPPTPQPRPQNNTKLIITFVILALAGVGIAVFAPKVLNIDVVQQAMKVRETIKSVSEKTLEKGVESNNDDYDEAVKLQQQEAERLEEERRRAKEAEEERRQQQEQEEATKRWNFALMVGGSALAVGSVILGVVYVSCASDNGGRERRIVRRGQVNARPAPAARPAARRRDVRS